MSDIIELAKKHEAIVYTNDGDNGVYFELRSDFEAFAAEIRKEQDARIAMMSSKLESYAEEVEWEDGVGFVLAGDQFHEVVEATEQDVAKFIAEIEAKAHYDAFGDVAAMIGANCTIQELVDWLMDKLAAEKRAK